MSSRLRAAVLVVAGAAASVPFAAGYLLPQRDYLLIGLASFAGYSLPALALVLLAAVVVRQWPVAAALAAVLGGMVVGQAPAYVGDEPGPGRRLVVMTANLMLGDADAQDLVRLVRDHRVEVLAVQELTYEAVDALQAAGLERVLPHAVLRRAPGSSGAGLWSSRPLAEVPPWPGRFEGAAGDVDLDGTRLRVRTVHPYPPLRDGVDIWARDHDGLRAAAAREAVAPTLVLGDFNASVHHRRLRRLMGDRWRDAAEVAGAGVVRTWGPSDDAPALIDPDHVLVDRGMGVARFAVVRVKGSDHRALVATVVLPTRP